MNTTLDPSFLRAVVLLSGFKPSRMLSAQAGLLYLALAGKLGDFTAANLPAELTDGSKHLAGAATGALIASGLLEVVGRIKSPNPSAKGRKLDLLRLGTLKRNTALRWLETNGFPPPPAYQHQQLELVV